MNIQKVFQNQPGLTIEITMLREDGRTPLDISGAVVRKIGFKKPKGGSVSFDAVLVTDGTDGKMQYVTSKGDLDEAGIWTVQGWVRMADGTEYPSERQAFEVGANSFDWSTVP